MVGIIRRWQARCPGVCSLATGLLLVLMSLVGTFSTGAEGQQAGRTYRIGSLLVEPIPHLEVSFQRTLRDLGWMEGHNLTMEPRYWDGRTERLRELAAELVRLNVDLIVAWAAPETEAAKQATKSIPIVFVVHGDPVGRGHVASLARPGGNITGVTQMLPELAAKRLGLLKELLPKLSRVAVLWNADNPAKRLDWTTTREAGRALGVTLASHEVRSSADFKAAFNAIRQARPDALMTLDDPLTYSQREAIVEFAARERFPATYALREFVDAGGLMSYGPDMVDLARHGAIYVDKIFRGTKPADLPLQQPTKFDLIINQRTAKTLNLAIPPSLLLRADQIVE